MTHPDKKSCTAHSKLPRVRSRFKTSPGAVEFCRPRHPHLLKDGEAVLAHLLAETPAGGDRSGNVLGAQGEEHGTHEEAEEGRALVPEERSVILQLKREQIRDINEKDYELLFSLLT